jgi:hypothetical protein
MMESSASAGRVASAVLDPRRWWVLALLCGAFFMVLLDGTITIVALPSIGADLGFAKQDLAWVLSAYALTFGGLLLLGGRAADLLGRRRVFMAGVLLFTAASLLCGLAWREPARRADRGLPVRLRGLRRAGRDRPGASPPAPRPAAEISARAARAGPGGRCRCRRRRGDQVRNEMSEQRTDSYHPRRLRRRWLTTPIRRRSRP